jgi:FMN phosphatase YigB (HAD superfamily)
MIKISTIIFDWGDTIMRDFKAPGPMKNWDYVETIPGASEMLEKLNTKFTCCIATSAEHSDTGDMIAALKRAAIDKYFHCFFSSADLGAMKPDQEFFRAIPKKMKIDARHCMAVGNLYRKDVVPAKAAGLTTVFFNEMSEGGNFPDADYVINHLSELADILEKIEKPGR